MPKLSWVKWIVLLSIMDAAATDIGIRMQWVYELNPIAKVLYESHVVVFYAWKIVLPLTLLVLFPYVRKRIYVGRMIAGTVIVYALLNVYHVVWISYVIFI